MVGFVFLVTKHHGKLYSPSDYGNADSFLKTLEGAKKFEPIQINIASQDGAKPIESNELLKKAEDKILNKGMFSPKTRENLELANDFFNKFMDRINSKPYRSKFIELSFAAQAPEYFVLKCIFNKGSLVSEGTTPGEEIILRVTRDDSGVLNLIAIRKDIIETNAETFAKKVVEHIDNIATKVLKS